MKTYEMLFGGVVLESEKFSLEETLLSVVFAVSFLTVIGAIVYGIVSTI
jgi:hypothetical protein